MKAGFLTTKTLYLTLHILFLSFLASLVFSFRAISSISSGLLVVTGFLYNKLSTGRYFAANLKNPFIICCCIYFLYQFSSFFSSDDLPDDWRQIRLKAGLVISPLAVCCSGFINAVTRRTLLTRFSLFLAAAAIFCLAKAIQFYAATSSTSHFFYHELVSPVGQHAVYFSIQVFIGLLFLLEGARQKNGPFCQPLQYILICFLSVFLVLLASKLVLIFYLIFLAYYFFKTRKFIKLKRSALTGMIIFLLAGLIVLFMTNNPVSKRFKELVNGDPALIKKVSFQPADYFNGLQFRLLQWKLVPEILNENKSWWTGVGAPNAQKMLNRKYVSKNMYQGIPGTANTGYLVYNTHNQLLESLLKFGIPGAILFLLICFSLLQLAWKNKSRFLRFIILLLLVYTFTESVLETQYGIIIFTFFPLFLSQDESSQPL